MANLSIFTFDMYEKVKVKLNHSSSVGLLGDIMADFPPHAILSRQGLIMAMLDILVQFNGSYTANSLFVSWSYLSY